MIQNCMICRCPWVEHAWLALECGFGLPGTLTSCWATRPPGGSTTETATRPRRAVRRQGCGAFHKAPRQVNGYKRRKDRVPFDATEMMKKIQERLEGQRVESRVP